jgi:putative NADH-flavin reductase
VNIVIFGAGGAIGTQIVVEATSRGHVVTAVHRTAPQAGPGSVRPIVGDVRDPRPVLLNVAPDVVVSAVGARPTSTSPDYLIYLDAGRALVDAIRRQALRPRLVVVGGAGSLQTGGGRLVDTADFPAQFREEALAQRRALDFYRSVNDVPWTYISPAALLEPGSRTGVYRTGGDQLLVDADGHSRITIDDYAAALVDEIEQPQATGRRMTVAC